jgi:hypothetical protein
VDLDFQQALKQQGVAGIFDENTVEVVPIDDGLQLDAGAALKRIPHRIEKYFGVSRITLHFVMPEETRTNFAVYFDTIASGLGDPKRYHGLVGDGDRFCQSYGTREIAASHFDCFCDFDGDGDLDLFKGGVEPYVYCYENLGGNRFVERGRLTSGGKLFKLPCSRSNRSWVTVAFYDVDGDGQQDFVPSFGDGPDAGRIVFYKNISRESGGQLTFVRVGVLQTAGGVPLAEAAQAGGWFPSITFVKNWDGDGLTAALVGSNNRCWLYRGLGTNADGSPRFAEPISVQAGGADIVLTNPRFDCADIDNDGDLDLFAGTQPGPIYWFENTGTSTNTNFAVGKMIAFRGKYLIGDAHSAVKVADFDGDGLIDFVAGRFWERGDLNQPHASRDFGEFHKNVGTRTSPRFERWGDRAPVTQGFQMCDAVRQNSVRACGLEWRWQD